MKLNIPLLVLAAAPVWPLFRLPKWLFNPLIIRFAPLPLFSPPEQTDTASASADGAGSSRECGAVLTSEAREWTSRGQGQGAASCRARVKIDATTCNLRVNLKEFSLSGGDGDCSMDKFWISTELTHGDGVRHGAQGAICGARSGAQIHVPVSQTRAVFLHLKLGPGTSAAWDMEVIHQKCEDNLVRKYGLLDSVGKCKNRRESKKHAKETFRRMKKYLFSKRRSRRKTRSIVDWVLNFNSRPENHGASDDDGADTDRVGRRGPGSDKVTTVIDTDKLQHIPSDFFTIATSSSMELSKYSKQLSRGAQHADGGAGVEVPGVKVSQRRNYKRRKSLFTKSAVSRRKSSSASCPVYLYSDSHGLTCMCKS